MTQKNWIFFKKYDSKNRIFSRYASKNWAFEKIWLNGWNLFLKKNDSKNPLFLIWLKELNFFSYNWEICVKELNFSKKKRCLEDFSEKYHSNFRTVFWMTQRIELLFNMTHRTEPFFFNDDRIEPFISTWLTEIEPFFSTCLKVSTYPFWKRWLKELNLYVQFHSKNWTFSNLTQRIEPQRKNDPKNWSSWTNNLTRRIGSFFMNMAHRFCSLNMTLGIDLNLWHMTLKTVFEMTLRIERLIERFFFAKDDSKNWTLFLQNMIQRIERMENMTQRTEYFLKIWLKELNTLKIWLKELTTFWK